MRQYNNLLQQQIKKIITQKSSIDVDSLLEVVDDTYREQQRYVQAINGMQAGLWDWDMLNNKCFFSSFWRKTLQYNDDDKFDVIDDWYQLIHPDDLSRVKDDLESHMKSLTERFTTNHRMRKKDNSYTWVITSGVALRDTNNTAIRLIATQTDISHEKIVEQELFQAAFYDKLTNLPNRSLFIDRLQQTIAKFSRSGEQPAALLYMDLDRFKIVNDSLGHDAGDELLIMVSRRIELCLRPGDTAGRIGGDEFAIILLNVENTEHAVLIANRLINDISQPFFIKKHEINVSASIGITILDENSKNYEIAVRNADSAMYQAKIAGKSQAKVYIDHIKAKIVNQVQLEQELKNALNHNQLMMYYQPIMSLSTNEIIGLESLLRWQHPERGMIAPREFLSLAEDSDLILDIGCFVMSTVCQQLSTWRKNFKSKSMFWVSTNISGRQIIDISHMHNLIDIIDNAELDPGLLKIEFAESMIINRQHHCHKVMQQFKDVGTHLSLDNFGTGHASLDHLCLYPFDYLKLDQSYITKMITGEVKKNMQLLRNVITLARQLNMKTIAQGIENQRECNVLRNLECDYGQGFYFSRPLSVSDINQMLANQHSH